VINYFANVCLLLAVDVVVVVVVVVGNVVSWIHDAILFVVFQTSPSQSTIPGAVSTNLLHNWPGLSGRVLRLMAKLLFRSPETGAQSIVHSALVGSLEDYIGKLVYDCKPIRLAAVAKDHRKAERLWDISWDMCPLEDLKMKIH